MVEWKYIIVSVSLFLVLLLARSIGPVSKQWIHKWTDDIGQTQADDETGYRYVNPHTLERGEPMSKEAQRVYASLNLTATYLRELNQDITDAFVFVTGAESVHFRESRDAVASIQQAFPNKSVLYYDLGLNERQRQQLSTWCNVQVIRFNFTRYPVHVANLHTYAFKFLIVAEVLQSYPGVFWFDCSARFTSGYDLSTVYGNARGSGGFLLFKSARHSIYAATHERTYSFLPTDVDEMKRRDCITSGSMLFYRTARVMRDLLHPAIMCSLDSHCIAPTLDRDCPGDLHLHRERYMGCHRYDQSVINILAFNAYNYKQRQFYQDHSLLDYFRWTTNKFQLKTCR